MTFFAFAMKAVIDPGHHYRLLVLDGTYPQELRFVKRCLPPGKYPGNTTCHQGTTLQGVMRCLIERLHYLQGQQWCMENWVIIHALRISLWLLEERAARRHGHFYFHSPTYASTHAMCSACGHTQCECRAPN